jgi:hypothetical protein
MMKQWNVGNNNQNWEMLCAARFGFSLKPIIPQFHYSNIPRGLFTAKPFVSDLAGGARFSSMQ